MVCGDSTFVVDIDWRIVPHRIADSTFEDTIPHDEISTVVIPLEYDGEGQRSYDVSVDGPLNRIYSGPINVDLIPNQPIQLDIDPKDLLSPNMYAEGTLHLTSEGGDIVTIEIILYTSSNQFNGIGWFDSQADIVIILLILLALSILPGKKQSLKVRTHELQESTPLLQELQSVDLESNENSEYPF